MFPRVNIVNIDLPWGFGLRFHACPHLAGAEHHVVKQAAPAGTIVCSFLST
jgi:hypothetical protein